MIEARGLTKLYGLQPALRGVSLHVGAGEILAVLGHNGSGKTTLVRLLATLARPSAGTARVGGHDVVAARDAVRRVIAVVGHSTQLYDDLTAAENLAFAEALAGRRGARDRIESALARVGLDGHAGTRVRELSSGMRRRLALARAILREPRVLLLDEAFSGLDHDSAKRLEDHLDGFRAGGGAALVVTHSLGRALAVADRVAILAAGRLAGEATRGELSEAALRQLYAEATESGA